mgnify:CR=1 FL=1
MLEYVNRENSNCYKWDSPQAKGNLPLWVADMDFKVAPAIIKAIEKRLSHGVFGYQQVPEEYYQTVNNWFSRRHGWSGINSSNLIYTTGVVPAISAILRALTNPSDNVATFTPAYNCFFSCISNLDCNLVRCELSDKNNRFEIDWEDFERKIKTAKVFILCNPHNPTCRIWTYDELRHIATICEQNNVFVISDEIHCEFVLPDYHYTPYALTAKNNNFCVCTSASKAFNIAGLQCANIYVPNREIYDKINHAVNVHEVCDINPFGMVALMAAYNESEEWIEDLNNHIFEQYNLLSDFISEYLPKMSVTKMEGTYLAFVNIKKYNVTATDFCSRLAEKEHVLFNPSEMYGTTGYIRINIATSRENLLTALKRMHHFVEKFLS